MQATVADYDTDDEESIETESIANDTNECSEEDPPATSAALLFAQRICRNQKKRQDGNEFGYNNTCREIWCLQELMKFINLDLEAVFNDEPFRIAAQELTRVLNKHGAAWVNRAIPISSVSPLFPPPPPPPTSVTDTSTQTIPPTPAQKPMTNSVSTNTDHPVPTYAEAATGQKQSVKPQKGKGKGKESAAASSPPPPPQPIGK
ncbi:hypothetical protein BGX38DRAFT_1290752 [Terfezia claveryi]|nr:hypothetical protein BGX38DRAFT_1290752 [Terfezia claveryi]